MLELNRLQRMVAGHEGYREKPYRCTGGFWTIGFGRNVEARPLDTAETVYFARHGFNVRSYRWLLVRDIDRVASGLVVRFPVAAKLSGPRFDALVDMAYNLGPKGMAGFRRMWAAIEAGDFDQAADEMLDSLWRRQVGQRAKTLAGIMRHGHYPTENR